MKNNTILVLALLSGMAIGNSVFAESKSEFTLSEIGNYTDQDLVLNILPMQNGETVKHIQPHHIYSEPIALDLRVSPEDATKRVNSREIYIGTNNYPKMFRLNVSTQMEGNNQGTKVTNIVKLVKLDNNGNPIETAYPWKNELWKPRAEENREYKIHLNFMQRNGRIIANEDTSQVLAEVKQ